MVSPGIVALVAARAARFEHYFSTQRPIPFLDDATTKNVLVRDGTLSGIVDVDWICYGDPLFTIALTRTSLLSSGRDTYYTDYWAELRSVTAEQHAVLRLYSALFCVDFLSELGQRFNREVEAVAAGSIERLERLLREQLADS